jgi:cell division protein FtsL
MKVKFGNFFRNVFVSVLALAIPVMLYLYAVQAKRYTDLEKELRSLEKKQTELIEQNKKLVSDISVLSSADRIEKIATTELGMHKAQAEDIVRVEMTGERKN